MKNILLIDDDPGILEAIKAILEFGGFRVTTAPDDNHIYDLEKDKLPSVILLDLLLSGRDGKEIAKKLKSTPKTKHLPIIMLSAHPSAQEAAIEAGADDFIAKPFDMDELLDKVKKYSE